MALLIFAVLLVGLVDGARRLDIIEPQYMKSISVLFRGYDIMKGNPTALLGPDPGLREPVFAAVYSNDKESLTPDMRFKQHFGTTVKMCSGICNLKFQSEEIHNESDYQHSLEVKVAADFSGWGAHFSASTDYKEVHRQTVNQAYVFMKAEAQCCTYQAMLLTYTPPPLHADFLAGVQRLAMNPTVENETSQRKEFEAFKFIETFGTHYVTNVNMGALWGQQSIFNESKFFDLKTNDLDVKAAAGYAAFGFAADLSVETSTHQSLAHNFTDARRDFSVYSRGEKPPKSLNSTPDQIAAEWMNQVIESPEPMYMELKQIDMLFSGRDTLSCAVGDTVTTFYLPRGDSGVILSMSPKWLTPITVLLHDSSPVTNRTVLVPLESLSKNGLPCRFTSKACAEAQLDDERCQQVSLALRAALTNYCPYLRNNTKEVGSCDPPSAKGLPDIDFEQKSMEQVQTGTVTCSPDKQVLSCGIQAHNVGKNEPNWKVFPTDWQTCECYRYSSHACYATCIRKNVSTVQTMPGSGGKGITFAACTQGTGMVTGCGIDNTGLEKFPSVYPSSSTECSCYNNNAAATCYATCATNIDPDTYTIQKQFGTNSIAVQCPSGTYALGCGMQSHDSQNWEPFPSYWPINKQTCGCYNHFGATCYAICGSFKNASGQVPELI